MSKELKERTKESSGKIDRFMSIYSVCLRDAKNMEGDFAFWYFCFLWEEKAKNFPNRKTKKEATLDNEVSKKK